jgi:hypothetical protein
MMDEARASETSVQLFKSTRRHVPEGGNLIDIKDHLY